MDQYHHHYLTRQRFHQTLQYRIVTNLSPEQISRHEHKKLFFFVHGLGGRVEQFEPQMHHLNQLYPNGECLCVCFDWLGHGKSDKPIDSQFFSQQQQQQQQQQDLGQSSVEENGVSDDDVWSMYSWDNLIDDAMFIYQQYTTVLYQQQQQDDTKDMNTNNVNNTEHVIIGHSMGSGLAMYLTMRLWKQQQQQQQESNTTAAVAVAVAVPDRLILIGTSDQLPRSSKSPFLYLPASVLEYLRSFGRSSFRKACFHPNTSMELIEKEEAVSSKNPMFVIKAIVRQAVWPRREEIEQHFEHTPVLVFTGESDRVMLVEDGKQLHSWFKQSTFHTISNAGHLPMLETPDETNQLIQQFLLSPPCPL